MSEHDDFRSDFLVRHAEAERAILHGDPEPRMALWSRRDPLTLLGAAGPNKSGWEEISPIFRWIAGRFSNVSEFSFDVVAAEASGDLAYSVAYERFTGSIDDRPAEEHVVRVTHAYRREDGEWKIVHRHGDNAPVDRSPARAEGS